MSNSSQIYLRAIQDLSIILIVTAVIYLPYLGTSGFEGNEPIRVIVAREMLKTGDWAMPILHGKPYLLKPPLMNWLIAVSGSFFGVINEWTARFISVLAAFLGGIVIYMSTGKWLNRDSRLFGAIAFLSTIGLVHKGRSAEVDSLFILFVLLALLIWFNGYQRKWRPMLLWNISLFLLGIGFLAKGPQIIAYFYLSIFGYLIIRKNIKYFFSLSHLAGIGCLLAVLMIYLSFILQRVSLDVYIAMWVDQIAQRGTSEAHLAFMKHLITYPITGIGEFMPWIIFLLPVIFYKSVRCHLKEMRQNDLFAFSLIVIIVNFPIYWFLPGARFRYFLPAGPFLILMIAVFVQLYLGQKEYFPQVTVFFQRLFKSFAWIGMLSPIFVFPVILYFKLPVTLSISLLIFLLVIFSIMMLRYLKAIDVKSITFLPGLFIVFVIVLYTAIDVQHDMRKTTYPKKIGQDMNTILPAHIDKVYAIGYDRFLWITCYIERAVIQLDNFNQLARLNQGEDIYFIFDEQFHEKAIVKEHRDTLQDFVWEKVYSHPYGKNDDNIIIGHIKH